MTAGFSNTVATSVLCHPRMSKIENYVTATNLVKDDDPHDLALDDDDPALDVDADAARMLQNVGSELADELPVLVVQLDL